MGANGTHRAALPPLTLALLFACCAPLEPGEIQLLVDPSLRGALEALDLPDVAIHYGGPTESEALAAAGTFVDLRLAATFQEPEGDSEPLAYARLVLISAGESDPASEASGTEWNTVAFAAEERDPAGAASRRWIESRPWWHESLSVLPANSTPAVLSAVRNAVAQAGVCYEHQAAASASVSIVEYVEGLTASVRLDVTESGDAPRRAAALTKRLRNGALQQALLDLGLTTLER